MAGKKPGTVTIYRDAGTGRIVKPSANIARPGTTVRETRPAPKRPSGRKK